MNPVEIDVGIAEIIPAEVFLDVAAIFPAFREPAINGLLHGFAHRGGGFRIKGGITRFIEHLAGDASAAAQRDQPEGQAEGYIA